jgi:hypothetical protein
MIKFEIINSPDSEMIGEFEFTRNLITLGGEHDHVWLHDPVVSDTHLTFEVTEKHLNCYLNQDLEFFHVNGKRTKVFKTLKVNDVIKVGHTEIKIIFCSLTQIDSLKETLNKNMDLIIKDHPKILEVIKELKDMIKDGKDL